MKLHITEKEVKDAVCKLVGEKTGFNVKPDQLRAIFYGYPDEQEFNGYEFDMEV